MKTSNSKQSINDAGSGGAPTAQLGVNLTSANLGGMLGALIPSKQIIYGEHLCARVGK